MACRNGLISRPLQGWRIPLAWVAKRTPSIGVRHAVGFQGRKDRTTLESAPQTIQAAFPAEVIMMGHLVDPASVTDFQERSSFPKSHRDSNKQFSGRIADCSSGMVPRFEGALARLQNHPSPVYRSNPRFSRMAHVCDDRQTRIQSQALCCTGRQEAEGVDLRAISSRRAFGWFGSPP